MERRGYLIRVNFLVFLTIRESMFLGSEFHVLGGQILGGCVKKPKKMTPQGQKSTPQGSFSISTKGVFCEIEGLAEGRLDPPILFGTVFPQFCEQGGGPGGCGKKVQEIPAKINA